MTSALSLFTLSGRRALVTGSSRGIGLALAEGLAEAGAAILLNARAAESLEAPLAALRARGFTADGVAFDVTDAASSRAAIDRVEAEIGAIDILINNAGIQIRGPAVDYDPADWRRLQATNLDSVFFVSQAVGRHMLARKRGKIINIGSVQSELGRASIVPYNASKGGVKMMTRGLAAEWGPHNIQVNAIGPGYFKTELNDALVKNAEFSAWVEKRTPAGRWGDVRELVGAAVFLASDASSYVNGHLLMVDGGMTSVV
ncbi:glucose 1-dehydrogenase [Rhabdaerophilum sp. SD176]|uniref:glucose 1-dehydrogenase n=1 Tax=Rhabdaerophilum sp. SD176 TaxID=2983548 RepID=UPI0024DFD7D4|nr:glucose 1-dehydrogenase [Rhabdaerophilum sp. SD176]